MINLRQKDILYAVINQFMRTGEPVSSYDLYKFYDFGIKPAMIRNELLKLSEMGYLDQPHYSSGRIPADLAYEFFIQDLINQETNIKLDEAIINLFKKMAWEDLAEKISKNLGVLSLITNIPEEEFVCKEGLEYLIDNLDWHTKEEIREIIRDFEDIEDRIINYDSVLREENFIKIFIGKKNPLTKNKSLSIIMSDYDLDGKRILILTMGPKRMNYKKAFCIFKGLKNYFHFNE